MEIKKYYLLPPLASVLTISFCIQQKATGENTASYHLAMTSRLVQRDSTFHELVGYKDKGIWGSPSQLWSVASFVNACKRAGVYHGVEN